MDELEYREEIWAILKEFRDSKLMTFTEVTDRIMAIGTPRGGQKVKITYKDKFHKELDY